MKWIKCHIFGKHDWCYVKAINAKNPSGWFCRRCPKFVKDG